MSRLSLSLQCTLSEDPGTARWRGSTNTQFGYVHTQIGYAAIPAANRGVGGVLPYFAESLATQSTSHTLIAHITAQVRHGSSKTPADPTFHAPQIFKTTERPNVQSGGEAAPEGFRRVRVHDLKHTFGRRLRAAGVSFEDRQDLLGHKSGRITTHYSQSELANLVAAADKVCTTESRKTPATTWLRRKSNVVVVRKGLLRK